MTTEWPPQYKVKRHRRAKYVKLRASEPHGLEITVPYRFNLQNIPSILEEHKPWIEKHLVELALQLPNVLPDQIEMRACHETWKVCYLDTNEKIKLLQRHQLKEIVVVGRVDDKRCCYDKLVVWLKNKAKMLLPTLLKQVSITMQLNYESVTIRDQKTLWGSCTVDNSINLNYKLIFLPPYLATHVLIHELSHTVHHNHSDKFWDLVAKYDPAWEEHRRELRKANKFIPKWAK